MILCAPPLQPVTKTMATMTADWCGPACLSGMQFSIHCHQRRFTHSPPSFSRREPLPTSKRYPLSPSESRLFASKRHCSKLFKKQSHPPHNQPFPRQGIGAADAIRAKSRVSGRDSARQKRSFSSNLPLRCLHEKCNSSTTSHDV